MSCSQCGDTGIFVPSMSTMVDGQWKTTYYTERAYECQCCEGSGERKHQWAFSCGTEFADWKDENCFRCLKSYDETAREWCCDLERALDEANMNRGLVTLDVYRRIGHELGEGRCTEFVER